MRMKTPLLRYTYLHHYQRKRCDAWNKHWGSAANEILVETGLFIMKPPIERHTFGSRNGKR